jgi:hypothetical protein
MSTKVHDDYLFLVEKLQNREPFAFAHFNDGEMQYIRTDNQEHANIETHDTISRGAQDYTPQLAHDLTQALIVNNPRFYRGIPCTHCFPQMNRDAKTLLEKHNPTAKTVTACLFHHNYYNHRQLFFETLNQYEITWMTNPQFNVENVCEKTGIAPIRNTQILVPEKNGYDFIDLLKHYKFKKCELVLLLCGPVGRILTAIYANHFPKTTFLCLGSYFDRYAFDTEIEHNYYLENIECKGCCPCPL